MRWLEVGTGECVDASGAVFSHGSVDAASVEACKSICEVGAPEPCVGINWVASQLPQKRCMIQALGGAAQADIEKAIGAKFNWWWGSGTAKEDISKAIDHGNGDWTATAPCWAAAPNALERPGGLGWSFVLLVLLGFSVYVVLGAARQRVQGSTERWPHAEFWRELQALVVDGVAFSKSRGKKRPSLLPQQQPARPGGNSHNSTRRREGKKSSRERSGTSRPSGGGGGSGGSAQGGDGAMETPLLGRGPSQQAEGGGTAGGAVQKESAAGGGGRWIHVTE